MIEHHDADLSGSSFRNVNLSRTRVHSAFLNGLTVTDAWIEDVRLDGNVRSLIVNGVDVTAYVEAELDHRHPERTRLKADDVDGLRQAWRDAVERTDATVERARRLPPTALDERVNDEFSFIQTLRHLVFAHDRWLTGTVFGDEPPYFQPLGQAHDSGTEGADDGLDADARPTLDEVVAVRVEQRRRLTDLLQNLDDAGLARTVANPNGGETTVLHCVHVVLDEEWWHHQYATRDLAILEDRVS